MIWKRFSKNPIRLTLFFGVIALTFVGGSMPANFAISMGNAGSSAFAVQSSTCTGPTFITVSGTSSFKDSADYTCKMIASGSPNVPRHSWSNNIYVINGPAVVNVYIADLYSIGDYYSLWITTDPTLTTGWSKAIQTHQVHTDSNLVAPTFNSKWDGTGTTYSKIVVSFGSHIQTTVYLRVNDQLFGKMGKLLDSPCSATTLYLLTNGCDVSGVHVSPGFSPAGFQINFTFF